MDWVTLVQCMPRFMLLAALTGAGLWALVSSWLVYAPPRPQWFLLVLVKSLASLVFGGAVYVAWYIVTNPGVGCGS